MHKSFYASGFLYHSPSRQILLHTLTQGDQTKLVLFRGQSDKGNDPQAIFQHAVEKTLDTTIKASTIHAVYDYMHNRLGEHFIFYAELTGVTPKSYKTDTHTGWIPLAKLSKYPMSEQTRHDIMIGERVIRSLIKPSP